MKCRPYKHGSETYATRWANIVRLIPKRHQDAKVVAAIKLATGSEACRAVPPPVFPHPCDDGHRGQGQGL